MCVSFSESAVLTWICSKRGIIGTKLELFNDFDELKIDKISEVDLIFLFKRMEKTGSELNEAEPTRPNPSKTNLVDLMRRRDKVDQIDSKQSKMN